MLRVVAVLVGQDPWRYSLRSFRQTTATLIERAGAEVEEGNPYWRFFQGWLSVEAPKRYVNEQLRPVYALDVIRLVGLTAMRYQREHRRHLLRHPLRHPLLRMQRRQSVQPDLVQCCLGSRISRLARRTIRSWRKRRHLCWHHRRHHRGLTE